MIVTKEPVYSNDVSLLKSINIYPSLNYKNSQKDLKVFFDNQSDMLTIASKFSGSFQKQKPIQCYMNTILNPDQKYKMKVVLERTGRIGASFQIGLLPFKKINTSKDLSHFQMAFNSEKATGGIDQVISGRQLQNFYWDTDTRSFEIRIHLREGVLDISDLPFHYNQQQIQNKNKIDTSLDYALAFNLDGWNSKIKIYELISCQSFEIQNQ